MRKKRRKIMLVASVITAVIGFIGLILASAAGIWNIPHFAEWGEFAQMIVSAACVTFGINVGLECSKGGSKDDRK